MTRFNRLLFAGALALSACAKTTPAPGGLGDVCIGNGDCAAGFLCAAGKCVLPANLGGCEPNRLRCNGADVEKCEATGLGWGLVSTCATGCSAGACRPQACTPGTRRCEGDAAEACTPAGDAWALVQSCPSHCDLATGLCLAPVCAPFSVRCDPAGASSVQTCDSFGAAWVGSACANGTICDSGRCQPSICTAGATRCSTSGSGIETCSALGDSWVATSSCSFGCSGSASGASCTAAACQPGGTRCDGAALEQCRPDQTGFALVSFCATGCTPPVGVTPAQCALPVCAPSARRCASDGIGVEVCASDGTGWTRVDTCPVACGAGQCTTTSANCQPADLRCNGPDAQACVAISSGVTAWHTQATCLDGCSSGACAPGGSCVSLALNVAASPVPIDGLVSDPTKASSVLVYSDVVRGADGSTLPDGTEFTVQVSAPATLATADADAALPGTQVRSLNGRVHFSVRAPVVGTADFTATATATLTRGTSCTGSAQVAFSGALAGQVPATVLVAEDFSTQKLRNVASTTADWNTGRGALVANWPSSVGGGQDGPLCVYPNGGTPDASCASWVQGPVNLSSSYAASYAVLGLAGQSATLDRPAPALSGGDEVLLWDAQGSSAGIANAGGFELLHVLSLSGSTVTFVEPIRGTYGAIADQDVATQRVVLQRVPHFSALVVQPGATVTADAWDGLRGGLLPMRVKGAAVINGDLGLDAAGFRGGAAGASGFGEDQTGAISLAATQQVAGAGAGYANSGAGHGTSATSANLFNGYATGLSYGLPLLGKLFLGAGGGGTAGSAGGRGGGAIFVSAQSLTLANSGGTSVGRVHADAAASSAGGGAGGSIWLSAPALLLGTGGPAALAITARGGTSGSGRGGDGRIRLDFQSSDAGPSAPCARLSATTCNSGVSAPLQAQSLEAYRSPAATIRQATLLLALDAPAGAIFQASASLTDPPDVGTVGSGANGCPAASVCFSNSTSPILGPSFRWKALLSPTPDAEQLVQGLQWSLKVQ